MTHTNSNHRRIAFEAISQARALVAAAKIEAVEALVAEYEETGTPVVVATAHVEPAQALAKRPGWALIDGSVDADTRTQAIADFQAGKLKGIVGTRAMAEGVTLTHASHMIVIDQFWSPGINDQMEDRIHRIGQTGTCNYTLLVGNHPIDVMVANLLETKRERIVASVDAISKMAPPPAPVSSFDAVLALEVIPEAKPAQPAPPAPAVADAPALEVEKLPVGRLLSLAASQLGLVRGEPRGPQNAQEQWAKRALEQLAGDCDGAFSDDGMGFNKADTVAGRYLGFYVAGGGLLDDTEWKGAIEICRKYAGQVGECPAPESKGADKELRERAKLVTKASKIKPAIVIERKGGKLHIAAPYSASATGAWRAISSRTWDGAAKRNIVAESDFSAVRALLAKHYAGEIVATPEEVFVA